MTGRQRDPLRRLRQHWPRWRPRIVRRLPWYLAATAAVVALTRSYTVCWVLSDSVPGHVVGVALDSVVPASPVAAAPLYWRAGSDPSLQPVTRGSLVMFDYAGRPTDTHRPGDPWLKYVAGLPGDRVTVQARSVFVNGQRIGEVLARTAQGTPLTPTRPLIIPPGFVFVAGTHPRSFDSRYAEVGLQPITAIRGRAYVWF